MKQKRTWFNPPDSVGEVNNQPSETVPDQTLSVKEIMVRYARGLPLEGQRVPIWNGEEDDMPDPRTLDLAERQELAEEYREELQHIKKSHEKKTKNSNKGGDTKPEGTGEIPSTPDVP